MMKMAIIGGGVAGLSAAIYALRANADVTIFEQYGLGGLTASLDKIENYPSYTSIEGWQLADSMANQAQALGLKVIYEQVVDIKKTDNGFDIITSENTYNFLSVTIATGTKHNKLGIEGDYVGRGVSYCATCDGNFYRNRPVTVAGNGNNAVNEALYLSNLASTVYVINPSDAFNADQVLVDRLLSAENVKVYYNSSVTSLHGEDKLSSIVVLGEHGKEEISTDALFVAVGSQPSIDFLRSLSPEKDKAFIKADEYMQTSIEGLFVCGDVSNGPLKQIVTACADGAKAGHYAAAYCRKIAKKK